MRAPRSQPSGQRWHTSPRHKPFIAVDGVVEPFDIFNPVVIAHLFHHLGHQVNRLIAHAIAAHDFVKEQGLVQACRRIHIYSIFGSCLFDKKDTQGR